jgi:hypothetical protein
MTNNIFGYDIFNMIWKNFDKIIQGSLKSFMLRLSCSAFFGVTVQGYARVQAVNHLLLIPEVQV